MGLHTSPCPQHFLSQYSQPLALDDNELGISICTPLKEIHSFENHLSFCPLDLQYTVVVPPVLGGGSGGVWRGVLSGSCSENNIRKVLTCNQHFTSAQ